MDTSPTAPSQLPMPGCTSAPASSRCRLQGVVVQGHAVMGPQPTRSAGSSSTPKTGCSPHPEPSPPSTCPSTQPGAGALPRIQWDLQDGRARAPVPAPPHANGVGDIRAPVPAHRPPALCGSGNALHRLSLLHRDGDVPQPHGWAVRPSPGREAALNPVSPRCQAPPGAQQRLRRPDLAQGREHPTGRRLGAQTLHQRARGHPHPGHG